MARFHSSVRPGSHEHPEHRRQDVHRPLLQLCSGIFGHGHGVNGGGPQLRMKQGVKLHQRDLSGGFRRRQFGYALESSFQSRSGEFGVGFLCVGGLLDEKILPAGLSSYPSSEDSSDKSSELRADQTSVAEGPSEDSSTLSSQQMARPS